MSRGVSSFAVDARIVGAIAMGLSLSLACGASPTPTSQDGGTLPLRLRAVPEVDVKPGSTRELVFELLGEQDRPVPDRVVSFSIVDDPPISEAKGATLSADRGVTNPMGQVSVLVNTGAATFFKVRASAMRAADASVVVFVSSSTHGAVEVSPTVLAEREVEEAVTTVRLNFHDGQTCAMVSIEDAGKLRPERSLAVGATALYASVSTEQNHAVTGLGLDASGTARVGGCVDLPGAALLALEPVRLPLPLPELEGSPEGAFVATSTFRLTQAHPGSAGVTMAWAELSRCPLDPARSWLDCTIDALSSSSSDPLDCRPSPQDEARFEGRITGRRGMPSAQPGCRGPTDAAGRQSLEAIVTAALGNPRPDIFNSLPDLAREAGELFSDLTIKSRLVVAPSGTPGRFLLDHRLDEVRLGVRQDTVEVNLMGLALPTREARHVLAVRRRGAFDIAPHAFTLHAGRLASLVFAEASLRKRRVPAEFPAFVESLFAGATRTSGGQATTGCAALDQIVCGEIREAPGCLSNACRDGLGGMARRLTEAFTNLDAEGLDFTLDGQAPIIDRDRDRKADALGGTPPESPGVWTAELRGRSGAMTIAGIWTAERAR